MLIVEGLITNENKSNRVKLSKTIPKFDSAREMVTDANVYIIDGEGLKTQLQNCGNGYYKTDSTSFFGVIGQKYTLHILTSEENEYKSEECKMLPIAGIDTVFYEKGEENLGTQNELFTGIKIFLNTTDATEMNKFFRWTFEETWKTRLPGAPLYTYKKISDTIFTFRAVQVGSDICWKSNMASDILINSINQSGENKISKQMIQFIPAAKSDRLTEQYSILINQYSISENEYSFWNNIKKVNETGGDIFGSQPYTIISNISNINNNSEMVLGYFEVSAVNHKRIFITAHELDPLNLPHYRTKCVNVVICPDDYPDPRNRPTWDGLYHMWTDPGRYTFVGPIVNGPAVLEGQVYKSQLSKFVFSTKDCSICSSGITKPDYWPNIQ